MANQNDNGCFGCLAIIGLIGAFFLIKDVVWPWFYANRVIIGIVTAGLFVVGTLGTLCYIVGRNAISKQRFLSRYAKQINAKEQRTQESKRIVTGISRELTELETEVQRLSREAMSS